MVNWERLLWFEISTKYAFGLLGGIFTMVLEVIILLYSIANFQGYLIFFSIILLISGTVDYLWCRFALIKIQEKLIGTELTKGEEEELRKLAR